MTDTSIEELRKVYDVDEAQEVLKKHFCTTAVDAVQIGGVEVLEICHALKQLNAYCEHLEKKINLAAVK